jgi:hypothetical protein
MGVMKMNKAFKKDRQPQLVIIRLPFIDVETGKRIDLFSCDDCADKRHHCYCLAA